MPYPLTSDAIEMSIKGLATTFPKLCTCTALTNTTNSVDPTTGAAMPARTYSYLKIGKGAGVGRPAMLAIAGIHAREFAPPDAVVTFAGKLLSAYSAGGPFTIPAFTDATGTVHGPVTCAAPTVKVIIENMDIYLVPLANPDGRAFCMKSLANNMWRKNCSPLPPPYDPANVGVDLNRNFDIAWDFDLYYSPAAAAEPNFARSTSKDPSQDVFIGPISGAFSQAETKNIKSLLDSFPITYYLDLHSFTQKVMYPWGIETTQTTDSAKNFHNAAWDHKRDGILGTTYEEYFPNSAPLKLQDRHKDLAKAMHDKIEDATGADYTVSTSLDMYPCTGTSDDYAFSRQFLSSDAPTMYAFSLEFGDVTEGFQPTVAQFPKVEREVHAALLAFTSYIAVWRGLLPAVATPAPSSDKICFIATAAFGSADHPDVRFLRRWRDTLKKQPSTRPFMLRFEAFYYRISPSIARYLDKHNIARQLVRVGMLSPLVAALRRLFPKINRHGD